MSKRKLPPHLPLEDGLIELGHDGADPRWIWANTCRDPACECRSAVIVASRHGKEALVESAAAAKKILDDSTQELGPVESAIRDDCAVFDLDLDTGETMRVDEAQQDVLPAERYAWLGELLPRIDGDVIEELGRLWYRGKGRADPETAHQPPADIGEWAPGDEVAWDEAYFGVRQDLYVIRDGVYEAVELYCVAPDCDCGRVNVRFDDIESEETYVGVVTIERSGELGFDIDDGPRELLDQLWAAYQKRHPNWRDRHARRYPRMTDFGRVLHAWYAAKTAPKVGPNDKCPCGSGKKYKKCCRQKTMAGRG